MMTAVECTLLELYQREADLSEAITPELVQQLVVAKPEDLAPGLPLYFKMGDFWGIHIIRTLEQAALQPYKDKAGLRVGVEAGRFYILPTP